MLQSRARGHKPQLIFTSDFHELVRGDLIAGGVSLRYDPYRIVPPAEIAWLPASRHPVTAYCRFHPEGGSWKGDMLFPAAHRLLADYDTTGQGTMLQIDFELPASCKEIECWFSYVDNQGATLWDSDLGKNFWMRFPTNDLGIQTAVLENVPAKPMNNFKIAVESVPEVQSVVVRWRCTAFPAEPRRQQALLSNAGGTLGKVWTPPGGALQVASETPVAFDLVYTVGTHKYTDDNDGTWYVVST